MKLFLRIVLSCILASLANIQAADMPEEDSNKTKEYLQFQHELQLDNDGMMSVKWLLNETDITFEVTCATTGWMGIGISPSGTMKDADIAIMFVDRTGRVVVTDWVGEKHPNHNSWYSVRWDTQQDLTTLYGTNVDGKTTVAFSRKIVTCDEDDRSILEGTTRIIWAYKATHLPAFYDSNNPNNPFDMWYYPDGHNERGVRNANLLSYDSPRTVPNDAGVMTYDFIARDFVLPAKKKTYYNCEIIQMKLKPNTKYHMIRAEAILQTNYIHHMMLYKCPISINQKHIGKRYDCYNHVPLLLEVGIKCRRLVWGWAIGGGAFSLPDEIGISLDSEEQNIFIMQAHYDNPHLDSGAIDSSGVRLFYTSNLRPTTATVMATGQLVSRYQVIPPGVREWKTEAPCAPKCLKRAMDLAGVSEINVFGILFHTHNAGTKANLRHIRNGTELKPLAKDDHYDNNFQQYVIFNKPRKVLHGDFLVTECTYDTSRRSEITFGGIGTEEEMCKAYLMYYPALDLDECFSSRSPQNLHQIFGVPDAQHVNAGILLDLNRQWQSEDGKKALRNFQNIEWGQKNKEHYMHAMNSARYHAFCTVGSSISKQYMTETVEKSYEEPKMCA